LALPPSTPALAPIGERLPDLFRDAAREARRPQPDRRCRPQDPAGRRPHPARRPRRLERRRRLTYSHSRPISAEREPKKKDRQGVTNLRATLESDPDPRDAPCRSASLPSTQVSGPSIPGGKLRGLGQSPSAAKPQSLLLQLDVSRTLRPGARGYRWSRRKCCTEAREGKGGSFPDFDEVER
jgi:hypothetical protein